MNTIEQNEKTRNLLIKHYRSYPQLQIQDILKFLYQSAFGCEHSVSSLETVIENISKEYNNISRDIQFEIEPLDGDYCRVPLSCLNKGLSVNTLGKLFFLSAKKETDGEKDLIKKLEIALQLVREKLLPFSENDFERAVEEWKANDFPAIRHSEVFREIYMPSYRVISNKFIPFLSLFIELDKRLEKGTVKLAIEGGSASGKTTLSNILKNIYDCTVFHMDDFFLQPEQRTPERYAEAGGNIDRERFLSEILKPLSKGETINYRQFDCSSMTIGEAEQIAPKKLVVTEGAYSMHPELAKYYDFSVFLDISPEIQKERILKRNSKEMAQRFFNEWIPLEQKYFLNFNIPEHCNMKIHIV